MEDKKQKRAYTDQEISLIRATFDNESLLRAIRKSMLQLPLDAVDLSTLQVNMGKKEVQDVLRKVFNPQLDPDVPFGQIVDLLMTVNIDGQGPEMARVSIEARKKLISYMEQQLKVLFGGKDQEISFKSLGETEGKTDIQVYIDFVARNSFIGHLERTLMILSTLSSEKELSEEEKKELDKKNSTK